MDRAYRASDADTGAESYRRAFADDSSESDRTSESYGPAEPDTREHGHAGPYRNPAAKSDFGARCGNADVAAFAHDPAIANGSEYRDPGAYCHRAAIADIAF